MSASTIRQSLDELAISRRLSFASPFGAFPVGRLPVDGPLRPVRTPRPRGPTVLRRHLRCAPALMLYMYSILRSLMLAIRLPPEIKAQACRARQAHRPHQKLLRPGGHSQSPRRARRPRSRRKPPGGFARRPQRVDSVCRSHLIQRHGVEDSVRARRRARARQARSAVRLAKLRFFARPGCPRQ